MMAEVGLDTMMFNPPDWYVGYSLKQRVRVKYRSIYQVCKQVQTDLGLLGPQQREEEEDEGKKNHNNTGDQDQDMEEEGSHIQNRKRNNEDEEESKMRSWDMAIEVGDKFDIPSLLYNSSRDYLIKNNGDKVKDHFSGKRVLLYFWNLSHDDPLPHVADMNLYEDSKEIYGEFGPRGLFEVVFVALGNNEKAFNEAFSFMPWLAIPHEDQKGRDMIEEKFTIKSLPLPRSVLFDLDGTVLLNDCEPDFRFYGAEGFPFTRKRFFEITNGDDALREELLSSEKLSLKKLLGEFVFSSEGKQVSTSELENYIVGLHFYGTSPLGDPWTTVLLDTWESLKDHLGKKIAIVSINDASICLSFFKDKFHKAYRDIPWYTLPYDGRRLCRVLRIPQYNDNISSNAGHFIIIQPDRYQPLNYFAFDVLEMYGIGAFPFTLERAVELEKTKQQKLELCTLLSPSALLQRGCSTCYKEDTTVSKLLGERVLLLFATSSCYGSGSFLLALKRMYYEKKGTNDHFEIIYISLDCDESQTSFSISIEKMPWLVHSFVPKFGLTLAEKVFGFTPRLPAIAAFGRDGNLQTKESNLLFKEVWCGEYPFIQADVDDEVRKELINRYRWDLKEVFPKNSDLRGAS